ncbi:putative ankyrin repeat domain-containing protein 19 isoform X3 [Lemur catta]|uniref:putative ankyrin repeat domain-containing protein 19 isoform X3 n=1 Tax=Lemur catta TaxID=9447 RepID=UPI001E2679F2|nr:putative ankyrin repeat domain-containing protein 19 isoform X3 [Lemur catta]
MKKFFTSLRKEGEGKSPSKGSGKSPSKGSLWKAVVAHRDEIPEKAYTETCYEIDARELTEFHCAVCFEEASKVENILREDPSWLDSRDWYRRTALHLACATGRAEVVRLLIKRKCKLNLSDNKKRTALMKAVQCQEEECVTILLKALAEVDRQDAYGNTALHYAVSQQNVSIAKQLLSSGAFIDRRNKSHLTPLLLAVSRKEEEMVKFLLAFGANINAVDKLKRNAFMLAKESQSSRVLSLLQDHVDRMALGQNLDNDTLASGFNRNRIPQQISQDKEEKILENPSQISNPVDEITEDPMFRISIKPDIYGKPDTDSFSEHLDVDTKNVLPPGVIKQMTAYGRHMKTVQAKFTVRTEDGTMFEDSIFNDPPVVPSLPTASVDVQGFHDPFLQPPGPGLKASFKSSTKPGSTEEETTKPAGLREENGMSIIENAPREQNVMSLLL